MQRTIAFNVKLHLAWKNGPLMKEIRASALQRYTNIHKHSMHILITVSLLVVNHHQCPKLISRWVCPHVFIDPGYQIP